MSTHVRFYLSYGINITLRIAFFGVKTLVFCHIYTRRYYFITLTKSVNHKLFIDFNAWHYTSLPDATSCGNYYY